jgi:tRNA-Thr(GGU) m(6)t(6)A37 methyltransferase TsaA
VAENEPYVVHPIGVVRSSLRTPADAPNQAFEGAPQARLELDAAVADGLHRIEPGDELVVLTWLHLADRDVLLTHPTCNPDIPLTGVFRTRSPDRPNPIGVHRVTVTAVEGLHLHVGALEAIDGTPIIDPRNSHSYLRTAALSCIPLRPSRDGKEGSTVRVRQRA